MEWKERVSTAVVLPSLDLQTRIQTRFQTASKVRSSRGRIRLHEHDANAAGLVLNIPCMRRRRWRISELSNVCEGITGTLGAISLSASTGMHGPLGLCCSAAVRCWLVGLMRHGENSSCLLGCSWVGKLKYERDCFQSQHMMLFTLCVFGPSMLLPKGFWDDF